MARSKKPVSHSQNQEYPSVSILIAAYNEELVIENKIKSILTSSYPKEKIEIIIGTDQCSDRTTEIVEQYVNKHKNLFHVPFIERSGKIKIINSLYERAKGDVLILTDANVIFTEDTLSQMICHFSNSDIGLVDSHMKNFGMSETGISIPEKSYISIEGQLKNAEGLLWGTMMGPFGGCFAIRKTLFTKVPETYLVDDFFLNMCVLERGKLCINEPKAIVFEDVSNDLKTEFKRKIRISAGNFQNLRHFFSSLFKFNKIAFVFFSHKVLRWTSPFLLLTSFTILILTYKESTLNQILLFAYLSSITIVLIDLFLSKAGIHLKAFRYMTHFISMNAALLIGFFKFLKGSKNSVWQRTERLQQ
jgi:cellulose synthase/poly-beta-1,6-N-acetylglucosamine synthase-like glycosyltransferase